MDRMVSQLKNNFFHTHAFKQEIWDMPEGSYMSNSCIRCICECGLINVDICSDNYKERAIEHNKLRGFK